MTVDEARAILLRSAVECLEHATCDAGGLRSMLEARRAVRPPPDRTSGGAHDGTQARTWTATDDELATRHREVLRLVAEAGHEWLIADETAGIVSATGLDDGELRNVDAIAAQLATEVPR